jgi:hypothetical protein
MNLGILSPAASLLTSKISRCSDRAQLGKPISQIAQEMGLTEIVMPLDFGQEAKSSKLVLIEGKLLASNRHQYTAKFKAPARDSSFRSGRAICQNIAILQKRISRYGDF